MTFVFSNVPCLGTRIRRGARCVGCPDSSRIDLLIHDLIGDADGGRYGIQCDDEVASRYLRCDAALTGVLHLRGKQEERRETEGRRKGDGSDGQIVRIMGSGDSGDSGQWGELYYLVRVLNMK